VTHAGGYLHRLGTRIARTRSALCLGIDPDPRAIPASLGNGVTGLERFALLILESAAERASAVKDNLAFFEACGSAGLAALERLRARVPADVPFIADAKRGDIGSTSEQHAHALFDALGADAVTLSPYLGSEAIGPLLDRADRFCYMLCRTSNHGAGELQALRVAADPSTGAPVESLALRVARLAAGWARYPGTVGLVVGATAPEELETVRVVAPGLPFLVPGVGTQGGDVATTLRAGPAHAPPGSVLPGGGLLVNVSRGIAARALDAPDPGAAIAAAAAEWATRLQVLG
jgi:orotidine-5'-phosphate decarboxylase